jgi:hypothetical protein
LKTTKYVKGYERAGEGEYPIAKIAESRREED